MDLNNKPQYSEREHFIDLLKGGIVAVVLQHSLGGTGYYEHLSDFSTLLPHAAFLLMLWICVQA